VRKHAARVKSADLSLFVAGLRAGCATEVCHGIAEPRLRLTVEACRDLALSLEGRRPDEARLRWAQASKPSPIVMEKGGWGACKGKDFP